MPKRSPSILVLIAIVLLLSTTTANAQEGGSPSRGVIEAGTFTYRASFRLQDGTEAFLLRSAYSASYFFQRMPPASQHYLSVSVGFYYGKSMLGRPIIQNITFETLSFYPKWTGSAGYSFNSLDDDHALLSISDTVKDGERTGGFMLLDDDAISQYLPMFGGTWVFKDLSFILIDGSVVNIGDISIDIEQNGNEFVPEDAVITGSDNESYDSDERYAYITMSTGTPLIVLVDLIVGIFLIGTGSVLFVAIVLHIKGKIKLPIERIKGAIITQTPATTKSEKSQ